MCKDNPFSRVNSTVYIEAIFRRDFILVHADRQQRDFRKICLLPIKTGPCRADIQRYAYNSASGQCQQFIYGGCHANANNFKTMSKCEMTCKTI
ncbi:Trypsin inhibitor [Trachymyrmex cornetzi]|uniref:Trypsin inhibitor n=1 Tax=Trachymyrmex cornetzi TaxID=471704 RepID=A0A195E1Z9_9HYME|nr:Trypsin inhibitor [Trachymyrmex cornetzi]